MNTSKLSEVSSSPLVKLNESKEKNSININDIIDNSYFNYNCNKEIQSSFSFNKLNNSILDEESIGLNLYNFCHNYPINAIKKDFSIKNLIRLNDQNKVFKITKVLKSKTEKTISDLASNVTEHGITLNKINFNNHKSSFKVMKDDFNNNNNTNTNNYKHNQESVKVNKKRCKRSKYKIYSLSFKKRCLKLLKEESLDKVSVIMNVDIKNLKRWKSRGLNLNKQSGRKTREPEMEKELLQWYEDNLANNVLLTQKQFINKAFQLKKNDNFKASQGWFHKFKLRHEIKFK